MEEPTEHKPAGPLPRSGPLEQGVDPRGLLRLLDRLEAAGTEMHSLVLLRHAHVVAEGWWSPYEPSGLSLLYSVSKSFTSVAVGLAIEEGRLGLDDTVGALLPDLVPAGRGDWAAELRVRHLLTMATGHHQDTLDRLDLTDLVGSFLSIPAEEPPGAWFTYHNSATLLLSAILTRLTGQRLLDYLTPRLLEPLGVTTSSWQGVGVPQPGGLSEMDLGFTGLHLATESLAAFGQLLLQQGSWQGRQLVPREWLAAATRRQVDNPREPNPDWRLGYGYQFWMSEHGYRADGAVGQFCIVLPEQDAVLAVTAATLDMQAILDAVWAELLPALAGPGADDTTAAAELAHRLAAAALPPVPGARRVSLGASTSGAAPGGNVPLDPAHVRLVAAQETTQGWRLTLAEGGLRYEVPCGYQQWLGSETEVRPGFRLRVAASAAWTAADTFTVALALVETPHRLTLEVDWSTGATRESWNVPPFRVTTPAQLALELARAQRAPDQGGGSAPG